KSLRKIAKRLSEIGIPYAVVGGMALFSHGLRRFTEDVDVLVNREGLKEIHERLEGLGYLPPFSGSKNLRDTETGVKIEFLITGDFPGDGMPKPVAFPEPATVAVTKDGICYVNLATLIELKLASGMSNTERLKDLADIQELIKTVNLPADLAQKLNPYVRDKYLELWRGTRPPEKRFVLIWSNETASQATFDAMLNDGVSIDAAKTTADGSTYLVTTDPDIARKYDMHDESELMT
ncbi:MAG: hypothetical protein HY290_24235, partial [Planctomycetia bacterium]|nr:hypothetical protein [Planctomycetia bacterium]